MYHLEGSVYDGYSIVNTRNAVTIPMDFDIDEKKELEKLIQGYNRAYFDGHIERKDWEANLEKGDPIEKHLHQMEAMTKGMEMALGNGESLVEDFKEMNQITIDHMHTLAKIKEAVATCTILAICLKYDLFWVFWAYSFARIVGGTLLAFIYHKWTWERKISGR